MVALLLGGLAAGPAHAMPSSGVQVTPDGRLSMVNKDVGDQRWAIVYDLATGTVTGNVFLPGGGDPSFVWCQRTDDDPDPGDGVGEAAFTCSGADRCAAAPCPADRWTFLTEVTLAESFFLPPVAPGDAPVPTEPSALFAYLQSGGYRGFAAESAVHASAGPHGVGVRSFVNDILEASLAASSPVHPAGAAAVKELYSADGTTLTGWAVEVKTQADSDAGRGWYWYEVFSTTDGSRPIGGQGSPICTGCHAAGADYVRVPYPLQ